jgi:hypothetical protein
MKHRIKMIIRIISLLTLTAMILPAVPASANASGIKVTLDGEQIYFANAPYITDGTAYVPLDEMFEVFGATVKHNDKAAKQAYKQKTSTELADINIRYSVYPTKENKAFILDYTIFLSSKTMSVTINNNNGDYTAVADNISIDIKTIGNKIYIPPRTVAEAFGAKATWDAQTRTVAVSTENAKITDLSGNTAV